MEQTTFSMTKAYLDNPMQTRDHLIKKKVKTLCNAKRETFTIACSQILLTELQPPLIQGRSTKALLYTLLVEQGSKDEYKDVHMIHFGEKGARREVVILILLTISIHLHPFLLEAYTNSGASLH